MNLREYEALLFEDFSIKRVVDNSELLWKRIIEKDDKDVLQLRFAIPQIYGDFLVYDAELPEITQYMCANVFIEIPVSEMIDFHHASICIGMADLNYFSNSLTKDKYFGLMPIAPYKIELTDDMRFELIYTLFSKNIVNICNDGVYSVRSDRGYKADLF